MRPTVTDAAVACGYLGHAPLAYDALRTDLSLAEAAIGTLSAELGLGPSETAEAVLRVAVSEMYVEVNKLIARFGVDPRDFTLMPFGGAGPMLGCFLARELDIGRVLIPRRPGVVCALGSLVADLKSDFIRTVFAEAEPAALPGLRAAVAALEDDAEAWLRTEHGFSGPAVRTVSADMRYAGQSFEIEVALEEAWLREGDLAALRAAFHRRHLALYAFDDEAAKIQIVNLRLVIAAFGEPPRFEKAPPADTDPAPARLVEVWIDGESRRVPLFHRSALLPGHGMTGPAIVVQEDTTLCIPGGFAGLVDAYLNLVLTRDRSAGEGAR